MQKSKGRQFTTLNDNNNNNNKMQFLLLEITFRYKCTAFSETVLIF